MGSIRSLLPVFGVLLASGLRADEWNKSWQVGQTPELKVYATDAAVSVEASAGNKIEAKLTTRGWDIGPSGVQVSEHQNGNVVEINVKVPTVHMSFGPRSVRLELRAPREFVGEIRTGDGSIRLSGLKGTLRAETGDGSIRGENLDGTLVARSGDGSVHIAGRFDCLQLHTQDGSVDVAVQKGSRMQSGWRLETGDGSARIHLPRDLSADLELKTGDGSIHLDLPLTGKEQHREHEVHGKLNGGGPALVIRTGDGSITVGES
jgi:Putative adhesin